MYTMQINQNFEQKLFLIIIVSEKMVGVDGEEKKVHVNFNMV